MNPAIMQYLDASTGHLPERERTWLENGGPDDASPRVIPHEYGWWVHVPDELADAEPIEGDAPALFRVIAFARDLHCSWINFDADADTVDGLETHE